MDYLVTIAFWVSIGVAVLGLVALGFVLWGWAVVAPYYREFLAKLGVGLFRFLAAGSAVMSRAEPAPPSTPIWQQWWVVTGA